MGNDIAATSSGGAQLASPEQLSDDELVNRICAGCEESLLHLVVDRCGGLIRMLAKTYRFDGDLAQELCVHLFSGGDWKRLRNWQGKSSLNAWVRSVTTNLCLNQWRTRTRYQLRFRRLYDGPEPASDGKSNPAERRLYLEATRTELLRAIERLSARDQMAILLHCLGDQQLTLKELADVLGVKPGNAATIKSRAIERLGKILREEETDNV